MTEADEPYMAPDPPSFLHKTGTDAWRRLATELELIEVDDLALLERLCGALDREAQARRTIRDEGTYLEDRFGRKYAHPALAVERQSRTAAAGMLAQLRRSLLADQKMELAVERENRLRARAAEPKGRDRRGGGVRRVGA